MKLTVTTFYKFISLKDVNEVRVELLEFGTNNNLRGLVLLATEGVNGTISGNEESIKTWKNLLVSKFGEITFKDSPSDKQPFKRWLVKIRTSIVNIGKSDINPDNENNHHLTPDQWNQMINERNVAIIDTRNKYETEIGKFKNAIVPEISKFSAFPEFVKKSGIKKDKTVLMYCTGGIRCEKALIEMKKQGYKNVYQLKGGILQYMKEHPDDQFEGECFVFDQRVSVDQNLLPTTKYGMCPHTGDPADIDIKCKVCGNETRVRKECNDIQKKSCSKDCAERLRRKIEKEQFSHN